MEKFQISVKNLNNLWSFIEIYAVFVLNLCGDKSVWRKTTNMRSELAILDVGGIKIKRSTRARNFILCVCTKIGKKVIFWYNSLISMHYIRDALGSK